MTDGRGEHGLGPWDPRLCTLAVLPRDDPYPVMQVTRDGMVTYANRAADPILASWGGAVNTVLPGKVGDLVRDTHLSGAGRHMQFKCDNRCYTLTFVPAADAAFVNVYGADITDAEQAKEELRVAYEGLESRVAERTAEIKEANERLVSEIKERTRIEQELREINRKWKDAQNQLLQSEKLASVGQLAAGVAHEINNPVGYIKSNLGTLKQYVEDLIRVLAVYESVSPLVQGDGQAARRIAELKERVDIDYLKDDLKNLLEESQEGVERVRQIVQDLRDYSHVDEAEWQWADIHKGLESTLNIVRNEIKYKADVVKGYGRLPPVECIPSQLNQVFTNLLLNASQAIEQHGTITIRTGWERDRAEVWVEVADTGQGIAADDLTRIFDPFFTTKPVGKGTGLGLSLSYGIVKSHNGRIEVNSTPREGTTFRVSLPVAQSESGVDERDLNQTVLATVFES